MARKAKAKLKLQAPSQTEKFSSKKLSIIALIVAFLGGLPGLISSYNFFTEAPSLIFRVEQTIIGSMGFGPSPEKLLTNSPVMLLTVALANNRKDPFLPASFFLEVNRDRKWFRLDSMLIPDSRNLNFKGYILKNAAEGDINRLTRPITKDTPFFGNMMILLDKDSYQDLLNKDGQRLRLTCEDVYGKVQKVEAKLSGHPTHPSGNIVFPRQGLYFFNETNKWFSSETNLEKSP